MKQVAALALTVAASTFLALTPARADKTLDLFRTFCAENNVDTAKALTAADKAGWMPIPASLLAKLNDDLHMTGAQGRITSGSDGIFMLVTTNGNVTMDRITGRVCAVAAVAAVTTTPDDFDKQVSDFAGVAPSPKSSEGFVIYAWRAGADHHVPVPLDAGSVKSAIADGALQVLMTKREEKILMIMMIVPIAFPEAAPAPKTENSK